jgi:superfamily II DNA or RNA helicase
MSEIPPLRPYQATAIDNARAEFASGAPSVVVVAPTGAGKSVIFAETARRHIDRGGRVLAVVHRRELARQAVGHFKARGIDDVRLVIGGTSLGPTDARVTVAAIQTLTSKGWRDRLPAASMVIWDECHHIKAPSFATVKLAYATAKHIGFTATPERADRSPLGDAFERMVVVATPRELIDGGFLVPCDVWAPAGGRNALAADAVDAYLEHGERKRAIVFCANVQHAKEVSERLRAADVPAEYVDGTMRTADRDAALGRFASGESRVITNCNLISEGFDVPACKCVVIARGCDSVAMFLQAVGRALRPESSGESALVLDLRGAVHKHGLPDADREFSLNGEAISTGPKVAPAQQCKACGAVFSPRPKCPRCGRRAPVPESPEVRREELQRISETHSDDQRREYWERLCAQADKKGFRRGWAFHRFKARYGQPPRFKEAA